MDKLLLAYRSTLESHLSNTFPNSGNLSPARLSQERFNAKFAFIGTFIFLRSHTACDNSQTDIAHWFADLFGSTCLFYRLLLYLDQGLLSLANDQLKAIIEEIDTTSTSNLYEAILTVESSSIGNSFSSTTAKNYRNKLGSYYTPSNLAEATTRRTIDSFFESNYSISELSSRHHSELSAEKKSALLLDFRNMRFADFSCGTGNFLIEIIDYFDRVIRNLDLKKTQTNDLLRHIAANIHAFDVDCIALEIAMVNLLLRINSPNLYEDLNKNFIHGNFLLHSEENISKSNRLDVFRCGFIYHEGLSLKIHKRLKYDVIVGNPPWKKIKFEEKKFYSLFQSHIGNIHFKADRTKAIVESEKDKTPLSKYSNEYRLQIELAKQKIRANNFFSLSSSGELNTYALFAEAAIRFMSDRGVVGLILKSAIVTSQINQKFFRYLVQKNHVREIYDFINRKKIFDIDSRERFCFLLMGAPKNDCIRFCMNLTSVADVAPDNLSVNINREHLRLISPGTGMLPNLETQRECEFLIHMATTFKTFQDNYGSVKFGRIVHFTNHSDFISRSKSKNNADIYEGKFLHQFDGMYAGYAGVPTSKRYRSKAAAKIISTEFNRESKCFPESRYFIDKQKWLDLSKHYHADYMLAWRSLTSATNARTCIATILPFMPASQSVQFLITDKHDLIFLAGLFNSIIFDYLVKKKICGIDLTRSVINQIPVPDAINRQKTILFNSESATYDFHITNLVFSLLQNDSRLMSLFRELGLNSKNIVKADKFSLTRQLDLLFLYLYGIDGAELEPIIGLFKKQYSGEDMLWFKLKFPPNNNELSQ